MSNVSEVMHMCRHALKYLAKLDAMSHCTLCNCTNLQVDFCLRQDDADFKGKLLPVKGKGQKKQKADAKQKGKVQAQPSIQNDTEEDVLQDYELSEDSDSD